MTQDELLQAIDQVSGNLVTDGSDQAHGNGEHG
jgi:hypothetical protein